MAAGFFAAWLTIRKLWNQLGRVQAWPNILGTTVFSMAYYLLMFWALKTTSAGNVSIIALSEVFFSFVFFNIWRKEFISATHIVGAVVTVTGALIVLSPNLLEFNRGDIFVLSASAIAPFVNFYQQRAREQVSGTVILFIRGIAIGTVVLMLARIIGEHWSVGDLQSALWILAINGIVIFGITKLFWIESIHRISVTKANALSCIAPFVTLLASWAALHTPPTIWQISAIVPMCIGVVLFGTRPMSSRPVSYS